MNLNKYRLLKSIVKTKKLPLLFFVFLLLALSYLIVAISLLIYVPESSGSEYLHKKNPYYLFFTACIVAPLFETLVFQTIIIALVRNFLSKKIGFQIAISALLFSLIHYYSIWYIVFAFLVGIILATGYVIYYRNGELKAFAAIAGVHFLRNFISFIVDASF
jgi:hypothetical protein